ncbi:hypothetical protein [Prosthecochloris sp. SCSIO W1103]|nr:hypothetical protein [Prosthecochloris sp. SCSIO W1103]UZJ37153.1 hypothetical protein OO005_10415 [Prosthecochloris sp. SCSIO W1103]
MDPRVKPEDDEKRGISWCTWCGVQFSRSHAALDAASNSSKVMPHLIRHP